MIVEIQKAIGCNTVVWKVAGVISCGGFALRRRGDSIYVKLNSRSYRNEKVIEQIILSKFPIIKTTLIGLPG